MTFDELRDLLDGDPWEGCERLMDDEESVFRVDWRESGEGMVEACERIIASGELTAEMVDADAALGYEFYVHYGERRMKVPQEGSAQDPHLTLLTLNEVMRGDFEVRLCIPSDGSHPLTFLPLRTEQWEELEADFGDRLRKFFHVLRKRPNVFAERLPFAQERFEPTGNPWWKFW